MLCTHPGIPKITLPFLQPFQVGNSCSKQELCVHRAVGLGQKSTKNAVKHQHYSYSSSRCWFTVKGQATNKPKLKSGRNLQYFSFSRMLNSSYLPWTVHLTANGWRLTHTDLILLTTPGILLLQSIITITIPWQTCPLKDHFQGTSRARGTFLLEITRSPQDPVQGMGSSICLSMGCHRKDFISELCMEYIKASLSW